MFFCDHTIFCMDSSGVIQGPPANAKPSLACMPNLIPNRLASLKACFTIAHHCGDNCTTTESIKGGLAGPLIGIKYAPPMPASFIASKSAEIPSLETLAWYQYQNTQGLADAGGD